MLTIMETIPQMIMGFKLLYIKLTNDTTYAF